VASLLVFRRDAQVGLGGRFVANTTTTAASDLVSFTCASLVSANATGGNLCTNAWGYLNATTGPNLAAQRDILNAGGYDADAGSFTVARSFATSVTSGMGFEVSTRLPAITDDLGTLGIREIVNDVLLSMPPLDLLPVTGVTDLSAYDVTTTYPWLVDKSQILGIYVQHPGDDYPTATGYGWDWLYDADAPRLLLPGKPFATGETFYLKAHRPAQTWIRTGGTWASDTDGLQHDTDEALPLRAVMRAQVLMKAYQYLGSQQGPDEYVSHYREREAFWTTKAYALRWWDTQQTSEETTPKFRMVSYGRAYGAPRSYG
jgi:hypothetical protein